MDSNRTRLSGDLMRAFPRPLRAHHRHEEPAGHPSRTSRCVRRGNSRNSIRRGSRCDWKSLALAGTDLRRPRVGTRRFAPWRRGPDRFRACDLLTVGTLSDRLGRPNQVARSTIDPLRTLRECDGDGGSRSPRIDPSRRLATRAGGVAFGTRRVASGEAGPHRTFRIGRWSMSLRSYDWNQRGLQPAGSQDDQGSVVQGAVGMRSSRRRGCTASRRSWMIAAARSSTVTALFFRATRAGGHLVRGNRVKDDSEIRCFAGHG